MSFCPTRLAACTAAVLGVMLGGCASWHAQPLPAGVSLLEHDGLAFVQIDPAKMPLPALAAHRFDPADGFDRDEVAMLAVANNPDLKLARDDLGIARAQAFSAGLLPDPQVSVSSDYPGAAAMSRAFSYGLSMDVMALLMRSANVKSANANAQKTDLTLLWQEWQVIAQARQLYVKTRFQQTAIPLLAQQTELAHTRYERMANAAARHDMTADVTTAALTAYEDARKQLTDMQHAQAQTHHDLNALLGLAPDVALPLVDTPAEDVTLPDASLDEAIHQLPQRRPDLIALQLGYEAQEQKYRAAILNQFPSLSIGFTRQRDTSEIYTSGFAINLTLPVFNRNRGNIAIEQATRQRLADEYQARLNTAYADIAHLRKARRSRAGSMRKPRVKRSPNNASGFWRCWAASCPTRNTINTINALVPPIAPQTLSLADDPAMSFRRCVFRPPIVAACCAVAASAALVGVRAVRADNASAATPASQPSAAVEVVRVSREPVSQVVVAYGSVASASANVTTVSLSYLARVVRVLVQPGQTVTRGAPLFIVQADPNAVIALGQARSAATLARGELERTESLYHDGLATQSQLATAQKALDDAQQALDAQSATGVTLGAKTITAPVAGVVSQLTAAPGDQVQAGAALAQLVADRASSGTSANVTLGAEPADALKLRAGDRVALHPLSATLGAEQAQGRVVLVGAAIDTQSQLVDVSVNAPLAAGGFLPGTRVRADIDTQTGVWWNVPRAAVLQDAKSHYLYQIAPGNKAHRVDIAVKVEHGDHYGVDGALDAARPLVVSGNYELEDGMAVRVAPHAQGGAQ